LPECDGCRLGRRPCRGQPIAYESQQRNNDQATVRNLPDQLEQRLAEFVDYYNLRRYHESLNNLTTTDVYFNRAQTILTRREKTKLKTIELRRRLHHAFAASTSTQLGQVLP